VEHLLLEGARRIDEWSRIQGRVAHVGVIPSLAPPVSEEAGSLSLSPFEWRVISAADGERDVKTIAMTLGEAEFDVARALFGLASAGVVLLRDPAMESARAAPRGDADALLRQGEAQLRAGNAEAARAAAQTALDAFPNDARTHLLVGAILLAENRFAEAEAALREAVRLDPGGPSRSGSWPGRCSGPDGWRRRRMVSRPGSRCRASGPRKRSMPRRCAAWCRRRATW
jgi:hypothetical protein